MRVGGPLSRHFTVRPDRPTRFGRTAAGLVALWLVAGAAAPAWPQGRDLQALIDRIERLQNEMTTMQRDLYGGGKPPASSSGAAPAAPGAVDSRVAARLEVRLTQLETELRTLTGRIERIDHGLQQLTGRVEKLVSDVDFRLRALEQGRPANAAAGGPDANGPQSSASISIGTPPGGTEAAPPDGAASPQTLGTVSPDDLARLRVTRPGAAAATPAQLPPGTPQEQYEHAISLLQRQDVAKAEGAFRAFVAAHPDHPLSSNAQYWLGETYYVRHDYQQAAFIFAEGFQRYPQSNKAPDSLLKLGMSLARLGKRSEACTAFSRLVDSYPDASPTLKRRVSAQRRQVDCP